MLQLLRSLLAALQLVDGRHHATYIYVEPSDTGGNRLKLTYLLTSPPLCARQVGSSWAFRRDWERGVRTKVAMDVSPIPVMVSMEFDEALEMKTPRFSPDARNSTPGGDFKVRPSPRCPFSCACNLTFIVATFPQGIEPNQLRNLVLDCIRKHLYPSATFFADKLVTIQQGPPPPAYTRADARTSPNHPPPNHSVNTLVASRRPRRSLFTCALLLPVQAVPVNLSSL